MAALLEEKSFRKLEDLGCPNEIATMKWSPKTDLIGIITVDGSVWLNRLSWQRVWTLCSTEYKVLTLAWRPDGKVLALGLDNGKLNLVNVENSECLHEYVLGSKPEFLDWVAKATTESNSHTAQARIFTEKSDKFLPHLPPVSSGDSTDEKLEEGRWDPKRLDDLEGTLTFLIVADNKGVVTVLVHGILPIDQITIMNSHEAALRCQILSASLDAELRFLSVVMKEKQCANSDNEVISIATFDASLYRSRFEELEVLALKYGKISSLMSYLDSTFNAMSEAWEDTLLQVDSYLEKYANSLSPDTSVSEEFLTLFTCGTVSAEMQVLLVNDLTEKGLKKLGKLVEASYSNIQSLAVRNLQAGCNAMLYHLNDLTGMAKWYERFGILGLKEPLVEDCIKVLGCFMLKIQELLSVIETSLQSFIHFFKWLYLVILQLTDEEIPPFVKQFNQDDIALIAEFLNHQLGQQDSGKPRFTMEKVGQYLKKKPLEFQVSTSNNSWLKFLESNPEFSQISCILCASPEKSLVTLHEELTACLKKTFEKLIHCDEHSLACNIRLKLFPCYTQFPTVSQISKETHYIAVADGKTTPERIYIIKITPASADSSIPALKGVFIGFEGMMNDEHRITVVDFEFYDSETLTVLLHQEGVEDINSYVLSQFKVSNLKDDIMKGLPASLEVNSDLITEHHVDGSDAIVKCRSLERIKAIKVAVSGSRQVACVLSKSRARIKLFDMAADEDGDETLDGDQTSVNISTNSVI